MAIGYFIDKKIEVFRPWSTLIFTLLGFLAGLKRLFALSRAKGKDGLKNGNERG
jgi:F0F1-type ATP synthase assembly protein I